MGEAARGAEGGVGEAGVVELIVGEAHEGNAVERLPVVEGFVAHEADGEQGAVGLRDRYGLGLGGYGQGRGGAEEQARQQGVDFSHGALWGWDGRAAVRGRPPAGRSRGGADRARVFFGENRGSLMGPLHSYI